MLLNITANTDYYNTFLINDEENLSILIDLLRKFEGNEVLYENILWIFANFCLKEDLSKFIYENSEFYKLVFNRFVSQLIFTDELKVTFAWLFSNLIRNGILVPEVKRNLKKGCHVYRYFHEIAE